MFTATHLGLLAGLLTTIAFVPQVWRIWQTRSARDISLSMYLIFTSGVVLWLLYGIQLGSLPMMLWNGVTLILATAIVVMKIRWG